MKNLPEQPLIPVLTTMKQVELFLETPLSLCLLQDMHFSLLKEVVRILHENQRFGLVHIELIHGISNDEFGAQILTQQLRVDGIISSKPKIIETAKKNHAFAIQRVFLIDSKSLTRGLASVNETIPDAMEVMPALTYPLFEMIREKTDVELWAGGLVKNENIAQTILESGAKRITVSDLALCVKMRQS